NICQHNHVRVFEIKLVDHIEIKEVAQPQVLRLIRFQQVEVERLEKQAAVNDITRAHIVAMALHEIRRHGVELNAAAGLLFVPPDLKSHIVAFKFSLDYFRHL